MLEIFLELLLYSMVGMETLSYMSRDNKLSLHSLRQKPFVIWEEEAASPEEGENKQCTPDLCAWQEIQRRAGLHSRAILSE